MKKIRTAIALLCFLLIHVSTKGQVVRTIDADSKNTIEGVQVLNKSTAHIEFSDSRGELHMQCQDNDTLIFCMLGYETSKMLYSEIARNRNSCSLKQNSIALSQMVVSGTKRKQRTDRLPSKVIQVPIHSIAIAQAQTSADLLGNSGEVFIQKSQQGGGSPMIRGFSTNRLLYSVDGVRMNTAIFRSGNIQNVISLDAYSMQNVEVFYGPGSVIYGSDAIGGVMSFETLTPKFGNNGKGFEGHVALRGKSGNWEQTGHFDLQYNKGKWAGVTSVTFSDFGDLVMGNHGPDEYLRPFYVQRIQGKDSIVASSNAKKQTPSDYYQTNLMQKVSFAANEYLLFQYGFHYSESSTYDRYDRLLQQKNGTLKYGEWKYGPQVWMMNNLRIDCTKEILLYDRFSLNLAQQYFEESRISRSLNSSNQKNRLEKVDAYSVNADLVKKIKKHRFFYGAEYVLNKVDSKGINRNIDTNEEEGASARYPNSDWQSLGVYINDELQLTKSVTMQAGIRWNGNTLDAVFDTTHFSLPFSESNTSHSSLTGSLGIVYSNEEDFQFRFNLAHGFRAPNVDDVGKIFDSEPGSVVVPNPDLAPEKAYNLEIGTTALFWDAVRIDASLFYTYLDDAMVRRDYSLDGKDSMMYDGEMSQIQAIQNAANANVYGVQFGGMYEISPAWSFQTQLNWQKGEEELDSGEKSPSRHAAPLFGFSALRFKKKTLELELKCRYSEEVSYNDLPEGEISKDYIYALDSQNNPYSPSWYSVDFAAQFFASENVSITLLWENISNQRYRPYSSGLVSAGSSFGVSMDFRF